MVTFTAPSSEESAPSTQSYRKMLDDVLAREKVIKDKWLDKTKDTYEIYEGAKADSTPFNILYSNTEILVPNLFSESPTPVVKRRFGDMEGDQAAKAAERMAEYCMDTNLSGYTDFVDVIESAVLDSALPGQGQCRVRVVDGIALIDYVQHDKYIWAYSRRWEDTPWIAFRHDKTREDAIREFEIPEEIALKMKKSSSDASPSNQDKGPDTIAIYEVWNKLDKQVYFICDDVPDCMLKELPDPLELSGFYPSGKPLRLLSTPQSTMPRSLYGLYKRQANELNAVTDRIMRVTNAIRVRGLFDGTVPEMAQLFGEGNLENGLIAASTPAVMSRDGGLEKHIWLVPIEKLIVVLQQLFVAREQIKNTIYEILGIGDILRGASKASETLGAQQIKDKWGSLRIKKSREKVSTFVRTQMRMLIEAAAKHTSEEDWGKITALPLVPTMQKQIMMAQMQQPQPPGMPPLPDPGPSWGEVLQVLRDDLTRSYTIDIETNSTVDADATEDKAEVAEFLGALGQAAPLLTGLAGAGESGFEAGKAMLIEVCKRFRMGQELEKIFLTLQPPPQGATPEQEKKDKELEQREQAAQQGEEQVKQAGEALKGQFEQQKAQLDQIGQQLTQQKDALTQQSQALAEQASELERQNAELELAQKALKLEVQAADLRIKEGKMSLAEQGQQIETAAVKKELAHQGKVVAFQGKQAQAQGAETKANPVPEMDAVDGALKALADQGKTIEKLLLQLTKPVKIVKTGPGTFERVSG